jgi:predicted nucleic acid-binding protein
VVEEEGTEEALILRRRARLVAPELLTAECANILWKKCQRDELSKEEAFLGAQLLQAADIEFRPTRLLLEAATRIAVEETPPLEEVATRTEIRSGIEERLGKRIGFV